MRAGRLDKRVVFQKQVKGRDSAGQPTNTWQNLPAVWANVLFVSGREYITADRQQQESVASIRIRKRPVTASMRVRYGGEIYEISAVLPDRSGEYLDVAVKAIK
ncbi:head-tail adaptor protein [Chromobacterium vaccinii]|uniref:phage head closure protein n=1 Tax=Chromobacterium vaccinii TaxID=1108595 RepID=UPI000CE950FF|nr:phage head closure protein [Chromobacterium vaccinii]AVG17032.1 head-tail adaptor protein [Chromobacterium vaccinii]